MENAATINKAEVNYRVAEGAMESCAKCQHFISPDACALVIGNIAANGLCDMFTVIEDDRSLDEFLFGGANG